jgi:hypothetical protein
VEHTNKIISNNGFRRVLVYDVTPAINKHS